MYTLDIMRSSLFDSSSFYSILLTCNKDLIAFVKKIVFVVKLLL